MLLLLLFLYLTLVCADISYINPQPAAGIQMLTNGDIDFYFSGRESSLEYQQSLQFLEITDGNKLQILASSTSPSSRYLYGMFYSENLDSVFIFGGLGDNGPSNDFWLYVISDDAWVSLGVVREISPRFDFALNGYEDEDNVYLYLFGGKDRFDVLSDFYKITFNYDLFEYIINTQKLVYNNAINPPVIGSQIQILNQQSIYVFSGCNFNYKGSSICFRDMMKCDINVKYCLILTNLTNQLDPSANGGSTLIGDTIYYFYGQYQNQTVNQMFKFNTSNPINGWTRVKIDSNIDCSRSMFGYTQNLYKSEFPIIDIFGGISNQNYLNSFGRISFNNNSASVSCTLSSINPRRRNKGTMVQISESLILFGGKNGKSFYNEIWTVDYPKFTDWEFIEPFGDYPSSRIGHAATSKGNFMLIVGGFDENFEILADYWILEKSYEINNNTQVPIYTWNQIIPSQNSVKPPPIANTCAMFDFPYFYYIGGESTNGLTSDLWQYDLSNANFTKIQLQNIGLPPISRHGCHLEKLIDKKFIYVFFGMTSITGTPSNIIYIIDITNPMRPAITNSHSISTISPRYDFAYTVISSKLFISGGQAYYTQSFNDTWSISLIDSELFQTNLINLDIGSTYHSSNYASIGGNFYIYSGIYTNGDSKYSESSNQIIIYNGTSNNMNYCGRGFTSIDKICQPCPAGTYKDETMQSCNMCPQGTYNPEKAASDKFQCIPCDYNYFNKFYGQSKCSPCTKGKICYVGAKAEIENLQSFTKTQPDLIEPDNYNNFIIILCIVIGGLLFVFVGLWVILTRVQVWLSVNDIFTKSHLIRPTDPNDQRDREPFRSKYSYIGSFFTGVTFVVISGMATYYIYVFACENVEETVDLVPSNTLTDKDGFDDEKVTVYLGFNSLRSDQIECNLIDPGYKVSDKIKVDRDESYTSTSQNYTYCSYKFDLKKSAVFETGDYILFSFMKKCPECYTSDITVSVEAHAAYHNKKSKFSQLLSSKENTVFKGQIPSIFYFGLIPAFYQDYTGEHHKNHYGYRITDYLNPVEGSKCTPGNIYLNSGLMIRVEFLLTQNGIYTSAVLKSETFAYFGIAVGAISGSIGLIAILMKIYEFGYYYYYRYKNLNQPSSYSLELERKQKSIERKRNPNLSTNLAI